MARDEITVLNPVLDNSESAGTVKVTKQAVTVANGISIKNAFENKNNTLFIEIENTYSSADSTVTIKAGDKYPNKVLGDLSLTITKSANTVIQIQDPSRFENKNGSVNLDFSTGFTGNIYAMAKRAGLKPTS